MSVPWLLVVPAAQEVVLPVRRRRIRIHRHSLLPRPHLQNSMETVWKAYESIFSKALDSTGPRGF